MSQLQPLSRLRPRSRVEDRRQSVVLPPPKTWETFSPSAVTVRSVTVAIDSPTSWLALQRYNRTATVAWSLGLRQFYCATGHPFQSSGGLVSWGQFVPFKLTNRCLAAVEACQRGNNQCLAKLGRSHRSWTTASHASAREHGELRTQPVARLRYWKCNAGQCKSDG